MTEDKTTFVPKDCPNQTMDLYQRGLISLTSVELIELYGFQSEAQKRLGLNWREADESVLNAFLFDFDLV